MERGLPLSPSSLDFEGFEEAQGVQWGGSGGSSVLATQTVVSPPSPGVESPLPPSGASPVPDSEGYRVLWAMVRDLKASRVDILRRAYGFLYSREAVDFIVSALRESSLRQYESIWKSFQRFCLTQRDRLISLDLVLRFLVFVFRDKGFQVNTIASFMSALARPLKIGFSLDLNDRVFSDMLMSMWLKRPGRPFVEPKWDLDRVLDFISSGRLSP